MPWQNKLVCVWYDEHNLTHLSLCRVTNTPDDSNDTKNLGKFAIKFYIVIYVRLVLSVK